MVSISISISTSTPADEPPRADDRRDVHSYGHPDQIRVTALDLDLTVHFDRKELAGSVTLDVERQPGCPEDAPLILDTRDLTVEAVTAPADDRAIPFEVGPADAILGAPLRIALPKQATKVRIRYRTSPRATALQWVDPPQTAGGKHPFLFTQSEAIHARSWIPLQDSPAVRVTYAARVHVPPPLRAVMAADAEGQGEAGGATFRFRMGQPIPSYLIALAVGEIDFRSLGRRTGVYAEPAVVEKAAHEFADTGAMVDAAETLFGPYRWGRYDLLVLPPSFPFGGMENPKLTFATPTVLAGDRSLVALVAHELAHSWSGNLVTNATWRDFWLNEGFTVYLERRIVEAVFGADRARMEAVLGMQELREELQKLDDRDEILHVDLSGRDPDEGMTRIPYEKGALFLATLERAFGRDRLDAFLRGYFGHFAFRSITTADFEAYLKEHLSTADPEAAKTIDLHAWLHEPGLPAGHPEPSSERFEAVGTLASRWLSGAVATKDLPAAGWSTHEWLHFLRALPPELTVEKMAELDAAFDLTDRENAEIAQQWLLMAIRSGYRPADDRLRRFLTSIGRRKFLMPLYEELVKTPDGKARARAIYAEARPRYHPIAVESVDKVVGRP